MANEPIYTSSYTGAQIDQAVNFVFTQIAEPFSATKTYQVNDFVVYDGFLYQCTTAIPSASAWDATKWQIQKIFDNEGYVMIDAGTAPIDTNVISSNIKPQNIYITRQSASDTIDLI